jgi:hypothetical protein
MLIRVQEKTGKFLFVGDVDQNGDLSTMDEEPFEIWQSPEALRAGLRPHLMQEVVAEMKMCNGSWSLTTAARALFRDAKCNPGADKDTLMSEVKACWTVDPICTSIVIIFWQRYICKLAHCINTTRPSRRPIHPCDLLMDFMPLKADRGLPGELTKAMQEHGWTHVTKLVEVKAHIPTAFSTPRSQRAASQHEVARSEPLPTASRSPRDMLPQRVASLRFDGFSNGMPRGTQSQRTASPRCEGHDGDIDAGPYLSAPQALTPRGVAGTNFHQPGRSLSSEVDLDLIPSDLFGVASTGSVFWHLDSARPAQALPPQEVDPCEHQDSAMDFPDTSEVDSSFCEHRVPLVMARFPGLRANDSDNYDPCHHVDDFVQREAQARTQFRL